MGGGGEHAGGDSLLGQSAGGEEVAELSSK